MRVLLITQEIDENSALLGVTLTWIRHLAPKVDHVAVLALSVGAANLPANVSLYSMGKERSANKLFLLKNFYRHLWGLLRRREVDVVFVHMVPRYAILAAPLARLFRVPIVLWNAHGTVSRYLRLAHRLVAVVVTASPESFRINSPKRIVTGHGIDADYFTAAEQEPTATADGRRLQTCATDAATHSRSLQTCATDAATHSRSLQTCATDAATHSRQPTNLRYRRGNTEPQVANLRYRRGDTQPQPTNLRYRRGNTEPQVANLRYRCGNGGRYCVCVCGQQGLAHRGSAFALQGLRHDHPGPRPAAIAVA